jgi:hypothetical protein
VAGVACILVALLLLRAQAQGLEAHAERRKVVAQVVGEHRDDFLGARAPAGFGGVATDLVGKLGAVGDDADPAGDGFGVAHVVDGEEIGLLRSEHQHAAPAAADVERHADGRAHAERLLDAAQLAALGLQVPGVKGLSAFEYVGGAAAVGQRQHVEAVLALERGQRLRAGADGDQRVALRVVEEGVDLVRAGGAGQEVRDMGERGLEVAGGNPQETSSISSTRCGGGAFRSKEVLTRWKGVSFSVLQRACTAIKNMFNESVIKHC